MSANGLQSDQYFALEPVEFDFAVDARRLRKPDIATLKSGMPGQCPPVSVRSISFRPGPEQIRQNAITLDWHLPAIRHQADLLRRALQIDAKNASSPACQY